MTLTPALRQLLHDHIHLSPTAWAQATATTQAHFASPFEPAQRLAQLLQRLPPALLTWWAGLPGGHVLIGDQRGYHSGSLLLRPHDAQPHAGVAAIALTDLTSAGAGETWFWLAHLLDHQLGCLGAPDGAWLSDGGGFSVRWQAVGRRIDALATLGYSDHPAAAADPHIYLAAGLALFVADRRALNVQDPRLERLLASSIFDAGFCRRALAAAGRGRVWPLSGI